MADTNQSDLTTTSADLMKAMAEAVESYATADKTRAEADKARAERDKIRSEIANTDALAENSLAVARADLETKQIANLRARNDNEAARVDKLISQVTGAVPDISSLPKSTVTVGQGSVLRQGESISLALAWVAADIAKAVRNAVEAAKGDLSDQLFLASNPNLLADVVSYRLIAAEAEVLLRRAETVVQETEAALAEPLVDDVDEVSPSAARRHLLLATGAAAAKPALVLASLAGEITKQAASLFELNVAVSTAQADVSAESVHASVAGELLATNTATSRLRVHHQHARVPSESALLKKLGLLVDREIELAALKVRLDERISQLGDPANDYEEALKTLNDAKKRGTSTDRAVCAVNAAKSRIGRLAELQRQHARLLTVVDRARTFADRLTTLPASGGVSALTAVTAVEAIASAPQDKPPWVLVISGGKVESSQIVVTRRIFAPRIQTAVTLSVDYFLVRGDHLHAAGQAAASASFRGQIKRYGASWERLPTLA